MTILLAEDDPHVSTIARLALEELGGHEVHWAKDGESALQMALTRKYDLILLDEMMPKMTGLNVCRTYQAQATHQAPVIFLTANIQEGMMEEFYRLGKGCIPKPFDPSTLNQEIRKLLRAEPQENKAA